MLVQASHIGASRQLSDTETAQLVGLPAPGFAGVLLAELQDDAPPPPNSGDPRISGVPASLPDIGEIVEILRDRAEVALVDDATGEVTLVAPRAGRMVGRTRLTCPASDAIGRPQGMVPVEANVRDAPQSDAVRIAPDAVERLGAPEGVRSASEHTTSNRAPERSAHLVTEPVRPQTTPTVTSPRPDPVRLQVGQGTASATVGSGRTDGQSRRVRSSEHTPAPVATESDLPPDAVAPKVVTGTRGTESHAVQSDARPRPLAGVVASGTKPANAEPGRDRMTRLAASDRPPTPTPDDGLRTERAALAETATSGPSAPDYSPLPARADAGRIERALAALTANSEAGVAGTEAGSGQTDIGPQPVHASPRVPSPVTDRPESPIEPASPFHAADLEPEAIEHPSVGGSAARGAEIATAKPGLGRPTVSAASDLPVIHTPTVAGWSDRPSETRTVPGVPVAVSAEDAAAQSHASSPPVRSARHTPSAADQPLDVPDQPAPQPHAVRVMPEAIERPQVGVSAASSVEPRGVGSAPERSTTAIAAGPQPPAPAAVPQSDRADETPTVASGPVRHSTEATIAQSEPRSPIAEPLDAGPRPDAPVRAAAPDLPPTPAPTDGPRAERHVSAQAGPSGPMTAGTEAATANPSVRPPVGSAGRTPSTADRPLEVPDQPVPQPRAVPVMPEAIERLRVGVSVAPAVEPASVEAASDRPTTAAAAPAVRPPSAPAAVPQSDRADENLTVAGGPVRHSTEGTALVPDARAPIAEPLDAGPRPEAPVRAAAPDLPPTPAPTDGPRAERPASAQAAPSGPITDSTEAVTAKSGVQPPVRSARHTPSAADQPLDVPDQPAPQPHALRAVPDAIERPHVGVSVASSVELASVEAASDRPTAAAAPAVPPPPAPAAVPQSDRADETPTVASGPVRHSTEATIAQSEPRAPIAEPLDAGPRPEAPVRAAAPDLPPTPAPTDGPRAERPASAQAAPSEPVTDSTAAATAKSDVQPPPVGSAGRTPSAADQPIDVSDQPAPQPHATRISLEMIERPEDGGPMASANDVIALESSLDRPNRRDASDRLPTPAPPDAQRAEGAPATHPTSSHATLGAEARSVQTDDQTRPVRSEAQTSDVPAHSAPQSRIAQAMPETIAPPEVRGPVVSTTTLVTTEAPSGGANGSAPSDLPTTPAPVDAHQVDRTSDTRPGPSPSVTRGAEQSAVRTDDQLLTVDSSARALASVIQPPAAPGQEVLQPDSALGVSEVTDRPHAHDSGSSTTEPAVRERGPERATATVTEPTRVSSPKPASSMAPDAVAPKVGTGTSVAESPAVQPDARPSFPAPAHTHSAAPRNPQVAVQPAPHSGATQTPPESDPTGSTARVVPPVTRELVCSVTNEVAAKQRVQSSEHRLSPTPWLAPALSPARAASAATALAADVMGLDALVRGNSRNLAARGWGERPDSSAADPIETSPAAPPMWQPLRPPVLDDAIPTQAARRGAAWVAGEMIRDVRVAVAGRWQDIELRLRSPEFGPMTVTVSSADGVMRATIHTSSEAARAALEQQAPALRAALGDAGLEVSHVAVAADGRGTSQRQSTEEWARERRRAANRRPTDSLASPVMWTSLSASNPALDAVA